MKKWYKLCPFCANEIKEWAKKCQYCKEFLDVKNVLTMTKGISTEKKVKNMKNVSDGNENKLKIILKKVLEIIFIIFGLNDQRITALRWVLLCCLGSLLSIWIAGLIALPFWINIVDALEIWKPERCWNIASLLFIVFLWWYILPKRAHDHWRSWCMWLIPIVNIYYFLARWDSWINEYWEKPSLIRDLKRCFYKNIFTLQTFKWWPDDLKNVLSAEKK